MSQPNEKPNSNPVTTSSSEVPQVVDIDSLEVEVLIICKNPASFQQSASFLSRRGMPTTVMGNLGKAIDYIVKNTPDFVLISCNHQNPGTMKLPSLLSQMKTNCIGFTETGDASSNAKLATLALKHKLQGLPSGPNIQRMIRKILMDIYNPQAASKESESLDASGDDSGKTTISNSSANKRESDTFNIKGKEDSKQEGRSRDARSSDDDEAIDAGNYKLGRKKERKKLKELTRAEQSEVSGFPSAPQIDKKALMELAAEAENKSRGESGMMFMPTKDYEKPDKSKRTYQKDAEFNDAQEEKLEIEKVGQSNLLQNSEKRQSKELSALLDQLEPSLDASAVQEGLKSKSMQATEEGMRGANYEAQQSQGKNQQYEANQSANQGFDLSGLQSGGNPGQTSDLKTGAAGEMFSQSALSRPSKTLQTVKPLNLQANPSTQSQNFQSLFEKSIQIALERTCVGGNTVRSLTSVEMVGTLPVDSPDLHGYLVVSVSGLTADGHLEFINKFRQVLAALFIELGLTAQVEDGFVVLQESFEFLEWAKQESALCMTTQHLDHSVGVAFLPTEDRFGDLPRESGKPDLALVSVKTIDTEKPIPFKAYLHFKRSDRLYLYLRNGRRLFPEQKNRLLDHKVSDFYIKSVDVKNYKTYSAANYIGQSFRRTKNRRAS